jgi:DNA mismatch repair protein MutS
MGGKSTFLRQNALIAIMAQSGSYVPAYKATLGMVDAIYSRIGASDDLTQNKSTFMVEMLEVSAILNHATPRSFVIMDEVGRGTSVLDGLSIAWATLHHITQTNRCRSLFATHYHELAHMVMTSLPHLACYTTLVHMNNNKDTPNGLCSFLHKIVPGIASSSYGLHIAEMAGFPSSALNQARLIRERLMARRIDVKSSEEDNTSTSFIHESYDAISSSYPTTFAT